MKCTVKILRWKTLLDNVAKWTRSGLAFHFLRLPVDIKSVQKLRLAYGFLLMVLQLQSHHTIYGTQGYRNLVTILLLPLVG